MHHAALRNKILSNKSQKWKTCVVVAADKRLLVAGVLVLDERTCVYAPTTRLFCLRVFVKLLHSITGALTTNARQLRHHVVCVPPADRRTQVHNPDTRRSVFVPPSVRRCPRLRASLRASFQACGS